MKNLLFVLLVLILGSCSMMPRLDSTTVIPKVERAELVHISALEGHQLVKVSIPDVVGNCTCTTYNFKTKKYKKYRIPSFYLKEVKKGEVIQVTGNWAKAKI